jgi:hypothetical protein
MNKVLYLLILALIVSCESGKAQQAREEDRMNDQIEINNDTIINHEFLSCMYSDSYFPTFLVDKCKNVLQSLCVNIEANNPKSLDELYAITHSSTNEINKLQEEFYENNSELETGARECLAEEFEFIAKAYGYEADIEELIATRDW